MRRFFTLSAIVLSGCAGGPVSIDRAMGICARGASAVEVTATGTVAAVLGTSTSQSGTHEGFLLRSHDLTLHIEDNVSITGPIPLSKGEAVTLQGQYECNDGVIHYTHHDPRGRHISGYIEAGGRNYH